MSDIFKIKKQMEKYGKNNLKYTRIVIWLVKRKQTDLVYHFFFFIDIVHVQSCTQVKTYFSTSHRQKVTILAEQVIPDLLFFTHNMMYYYNYVKITSNLAKLRAV